MTPVEQKFSHNTNNQKHRFKYIRNENILTSILQ